MFSDWNRLIFYNVPAFGGAAFIPTDEIVCELNGLKRSGSLFTRSFKHVDDGDLVERFGDIDDRDLRSTGWNTFSDFPFSDGVKFGDVRGLF